MKKILRLFFVILFVLFLSGCTNNIESKNEDVLKIGKVDVIFASEYFEHIQEPFEHLEDIILNNKPKFLILANSFNKRAIGHFHKYYYKNQIIDESKAQRRFMEICKANNYKQISAKLWNNTPIILEYTENIKKESRKLF